MQLTTQGVTETDHILPKLKRVLAILSWAAGLLLAGCDGPMMPYVNLMGVLLFAGASLWLARQASAPEPGASASPRRFSRHFSGPAAPVQRLKTATRRQVAAMASCPGKGGGIRPRYARELGVV